MNDDKDIEVLKPRDQWIAAEKMALSCNYKAKTVIYNVIDVIYFKLISQYESAWQTQKKLKNMFEYATRTKQTKLNMLAFKFENLWMDEEEIAAQFSSKLCDIK